MMRNINGLVWNALNYIFNCILSNLYVNQHKICYYSSYRLYKPVNDWLELLPLDSTGLNM